MTKQDIYIGTDSGATTSKVGGVRADRHNHLNQTSSTPDQFAQRP
ncbi:MAG: hypothetical protein WDM76_18580 [Limisphaerales bacterium]